MLSAHAKCLEDVHHCDDGVRVLRIRALLLLHMRSKFLSILASLYVMIDLFVEVGRIIKVIGGKDLSTVVLMGRIDHR